MRYTVLIIASADPETPFSDKIAPASAWIPLLYDTTVIVLVIARTLPTNKHKVTFKAIGSEMLREGIVYYGVVFAVTFALTLMIAFADTGIKNICAQYAPPRVPLLASSLTDLLDWSSASPL